MNGIGMFSTPDSMRTETFKAVEIAYKVDVEPVVVVHVIISNYRKNDKA